MKVYVVTQGCYSNYHICAVTVDPEEAEKLAVIYSDRYNSAEVEEYDTEQHANWMAGRIPYEVQFWRNCSHGPSVYLLALEKECTPGVYPSESRYVEMKVRLYAESEAKALKIAQDMRTKYQAEQAGL